MPRETCPEGLDLIKEFEGLRLVAYDDLQPGRTLKPGDKVHGTLTIGIGHTGPDVRIGQTCTEAEAFRWLAADLDEAEAAVERLVAVQLNDHEFAALASFVFNVGGGAFAGSTLLKLLNKGERRLAAAEFAKWNKSKGKVLTGLVRRRAAEAALFLKPVDGEALAIPAEVEPQPSHASTAARGGAAAAGGALAAGGVVAEAVGVGNSARSFLESENGILIGVGIAILAVGAYLLWRRFKRGASS